MKTTASAFFIIAILIASFSNLIAQENYKHPHLNSSGQVLDSTGTKLGWIKEGVIYKGSPHETDYKVR